jgi:ubiquinone/menaquinone biosynthesis C-methylase UbiE
MKDTKFEVAEDFLTIGRTFAEYRGMLDLDPAGLAGRSVLDCGGGAGSFAATAAAFGADTVAVDPLYGPPAGELEPGLERAVEETVDQLHEKRDGFVWEYYPDVETRGRYLQAAAERFLADYAHHPDRYVDGALPALPLDTDAVDLAVVTNLLFLYDDRLDRSFHVDALRELARVAREEVRVFPLESLERVRSPFVGRAADALRTDGHAVETRAVPYEFQLGATEMLVVTVGGR